MDFRTETTALIARLLALVALFMGLGDAAWLLGIGTGSASPVTLLGGPPFLFLATLCVTRLFAAVGLWIGAGWGAIVLIGALGIELGLFLAGSVWVTLSLWGFIFKLVTMLATIGLVSFVWLAMRRQAAD